MFEQLIQNCPVCGTPVTPLDNFCPKCGNPLVPVVKKGISLGKKIYIYGVSALLPPLGLIWFFKYWQSTDPSEKRVAWIAFILTAVFSLITIWSAVALLQGFLNTYSTYTNLGV